MPVRDFDHFLLTRFNVRIEERASEGWLRHRLRYFEALCRASVVSQTEPSFTWLVYFDADRDPWFQTEIDRLSEGAFEPIWVDGPMTSARAAADIASRSDSRTPDIGGGPAGHVYCLATVFAHPGYSKYSGT
jgi:hypothetical protein